MKYEIKNRFSGELIFSFETESMKLCVEAAFRAGTNLSRANLSGVDLYRANLSGANLSGADLSRANLSRANLSEADLYGANLSRADLYGANLSGANLSGANLSRANLSGANLYAANLSRASLSGVDLSGADLYAANMSRASLSGASLHGANLSGANLSGAKYGDGVPIENKPIELASNKYHILVMDTHIKIGCRLYKYTEWENFTDDEISKMDNGALEWWNEWKGIVLSLSLGHQQRIAKSKNEDV